jgi:hypothetical protein
VLCCVVLCCVVLCCVVLCCVVLCCVEAQVHGHRDVSWTGTGAVALAVKEGSYWVCICFLHVVYCFILTSSQRREALLVMSRHIRLLMLIIVFLWDMCMFVYVCMRVCVCVCYWLAEYRINQ